MVVGKSPFKGATRPATLVKITTHDYEPLPSELPAPLRAGIEAALAVDPAERPVSPEQLAALVGAPMPATAPEVSGEAPAVVEVSAVGMPGEIEPSLAGAQTPVEATISDQGVNLHGGEKTVSGERVVPDAGGAKFVGREHELESLRREYRAVLEGRGRTVLIVGDAGVGKTSLLDELSMWGRQQRAVVLRGRFFSYEGDRPPPYETFLWMLSQQRSSQSAHAIARENRPASKGIDPGHDKWQVFNTMASAFVEQAHGKPLVLGMDDLQWASALDLEFLSYLPRAAEHAVVMIVGTARSGALQGADEYNRWVARLGAQRAVKTIEVERFDTAEVRSWFQAAFPGSGSDRRIFGGCSTRRAGTRTT